MAGYIGNVPVPQATQTRDNFTATAGQTSFATSGYTPGYLDVYLNGVRLDESDYTATNGSDVVLDTGAALDDVVTVVAFQTFEVAGDEFTLTDITAQDSNGIQFNTDEGTERARIDDSGNLLVGTTESNPTSSSVNVAGQAFSATGGVRSTVDANPAATFNRKTSDGPIALFRKNGTSVGSIGTNTATLYIAGTDTGLQFNSGSDQIRPCNASGSSRDNAISLGTSGARFKDLYLSGGVYLGGTGSANYLDDYEEGTWTPAVVGATTSGTTTYDGAAAQRGHYVKIGNWVHAQGYLDITAQTGTGTLVIEGLPFNSSAYAADKAQAVGIIMTSGLNLPSTGNMTLYNNPNNDNLEIYISTDNGSWSAVTMSNEAWQAHFSISYLTW